MLSNNLKTCKQETARMLADIFGYYGELKVISDAVTNDKLS